MSAPKPKLSLCKDSNKAQIQNMQVLLTANKAYGSFGSIPLPYNTDGKLGSSPCSEIDPNKGFGRAGCIFFTHWEGNTYIFLNLFKGTDRASKVIELSDLGGRREGDETFIRTACYEAAEETLGLFNFLGQEQSIRQIAFASYTLDRSLITMAVPVRLHKHPLELAEQYMRLKLIINGPLEEPEVLPPVRLTTRKLLFQPHENAPSLFKRSLPTVEQTSPTDVLPLKKSSRRPKT